MDPMQSAYRQSHSTESAMLKVKADTDLILDDNDAMLPVLFDQSTAFDTIHHSTLLERLEHEMPLSGSNPILRIAINAWLRRTGNLSGPPWCSTRIGPWMPLKDVIKKYRLQRYHYTDDSQLYIRLKLNENLTTGINKPVIRMERCLEEVRPWLAANHLKLNEGKTEVLVISRRPRTKKALDRTSNPVQSSVTLEAGFTQI
jgi:hypothetical protein